MRSFDPAAAPRKPGLTPARAALIAVVLVLLLASALGIDELRGHTRYSSPLSRRVAVAPHAKRAGRLRSAPHELAAQVTNAGEHHHHKTPHRAYSLKVGVAAQPSAPLETPPSRTRIAARRNGSQEARPGVAPAPSAATPSSAAASADQPAYLSLYVNGMDEGEVLAIVRPGDILVPIAALGRAGIQGAAGATQTIKGQPYVSLRSLAPGIAYTFDEQNLSVKLIAQTRYFGATVVNLGSQQPASLTYAKSASSFFNYALDWQNFQALNEFSELGVSSHGDLYYTGFNIAPGGRFIRALTNATFDNPALMKRWVVGDAFADNGVLGGGTFLGGISVSRNFTLNPYFIRFPGVGVAGQILTPSTADIYVNGVLVGSRQLPPGQFDITNIPVVSGAGNTQVVLRDAFGRTQTISSSYYFATTLLERGLSEYSYNLGAVRSNIGTSSWDYGPVMFVGHDRVGITNWFTAGGLLDAGNGMVSGGPTATFAVGHGQVGVSGALSTASGFGGGAAQVDYNYQNRWVNYGFALAGESAHYANASLTPTAERTTRFADAFAAFQIGPRANLSIDYTASGLRDDGNREQVFLTGSYRLSQKFDLVGSAEHLHGSLAPANVYFLQLNYQLGRNSLAAVSQQGGTGGAGSAVSLQQSLPLGTGVGYQLEHGTGSQITNNDLVQVQTSYGLYQAAYQQISGSTQKDLLASGGLVDAGDGIMFTRAVEDGYAIIALPDLRGVRGYFNNQLIGRTDGKGRLLIPNLLSYYDNRVEISDQDIPLDYSVDATEETVATTYRGGALVHFPVRRESAVTGTMVVDDAAKRVVPSFGQLRVTIGGQTVVSELTRNGDFYLENILPGRYAGEVEYADGMCTFELDIPDSREAVTQVGRVSCAAPQVGRATP